MTEAAENVLAGGMTGEEILLSLLYPLTAADLTEEQAAIFADAVAEQNRFMAENGTSGGLGIKSESVGDVKVTYDTAVSVGEMTWNGLSIAPGARSLLLRGGLLRRWA